MTKTLVQNGFEPRQEKLHWKLRRTLVDWMVGIADRSDLDIRKYGRTLYASTMGRGVYRRKL